MYKRTMYKTYKEFRKAYKETGMHFFDKKTMEFFQSVIYPETYTVINNVPYFITSEIYPYRRKEFSVRKVIIEDDKILWIQIVQNRIKDFETAKSFLRGLN